jgi:hypothetical protein
MEVTQLPTGARRSDEDQDRAEGDLGLTLVLMALLLTSMLTVVALVIDLGYVRGSARLDQSIADLAALAGGEKLEQERYVEACEDMIEYLNLNAGGMPAIDATPFCAPMGTTVCTDGSLAQAMPSTTSGKYTVTIEFPVEDEAGEFPAMGAGMQDGPPCDRMRVTVRSVDQPFFGGIAGAEEYEAVRSATLRAGPGEVSKAPALWLLEPYGCSTLRSTGSATIVVGDMTATVVDENGVPQVRPIEGLITADSDGTQTNGSDNCGGQSVVITAGQGNIHAVPHELTPGGPYEEYGEIRTPAMSRWATSCTGTKACDESEITAGKLLPRPTHVPRRATRAPVDWRWNCKTGYPDYTVPSGPGLEIPDCAWATTPAPNETNPRAPYIDLLRQSVGATSATISDPPTGWNVYPGSGQSCNVSGHVQLAAGNWFVNCNTLSVSGGNSITFLGGNVVTRGGISTTGDGTVRFNHANPTTALPSLCIPLIGQSLCHDSSTNAAWVYMRSGNLDFSGSLFAKGTMIYQHNGYIKLSGQADLDWTAPTEGPFAGLAAWSELASSQYAVGGGGNVRMAGAFFTPYANAMDVGGSGTWDVQNAQYISRRINFVGGATLRMAPDPVTALTLPPREGFLIR